jgi:two-component system nitrogen regulation response regulator GlnG
MDHNWPGNVRELENVIYRSAVISQGDAILIKDVPAEIRDAGGSSTTPFVAVDAVAPAAVKTEPALPATPALNFETAVDFIYAQLKLQEGGAILKTVERELIHRVLKDTGGDLSKAAEKLGLTRAALRKRLEEFDLKV